MGTVKVDCRHDAVAALLVDDPLDRLAVVRDRLVRAVDVWLLQDPLVKATHRKVRHHRLHIVVADKTLSNFSWFFCSVFFEVLALQIFHDSGCPRTSFWLPFWLDFESSGPLGKQLKVL